MLTLKTLELHDFGPYRGQQKIEFAPEGVTVIWGENGNGKTTLFNAFRFALYGEVLDRGARRRSFRDISNRDSAKAGNYTFTVSLTFDYDGEEYELTRSCRLRPGIQRPRTNADYEEEVVLRVEDAAKGPEERDHLLRTVLPKDVARFFLFDGELLAEYEQLLLDDSPDGEKISKEIERILGIPYLQKGFQHLDLLADEAIMDVSREDKQNNKITQITTELANDVELRRRRREGLELDRADLKVMEEERDATEALLREEERNERLIDAMDTHEAEIKKANEDEQSALGDLRDHLKNAWRGLLAPSLDAVAERANDEAQAAVSNVLLTFRAEAVDSGECAVCERPLADETQRQLAETLPAAQVRTVSEVLEGASAQLSRVAGLAKVRESSRADDVRKAWSRVEDARLDRAQAESALQQVMAQLDQVTAGTVREKRSSLSDLSEKIVIRKASIEKATEAIGNLTARIERLETERKAAGAVTSSAATARRDLLTKSAEIFKSAIDGYRDGLREKVEDKATDLFLKLISRPDYYSGLRINNAYGLTLLLADGDEDQGRSAGQEQIIAMALMGSLQANAPIGGPIVADSPFIRLDGTHKANLAHTLPGMVRQTILLVFRAEIEREVLHAQVGPALRREYSINSVSESYARVDKVVS